MILSTEPSHHPSTLFFEIGAPREPGTCRFGQRESKKDLSVSASPALLLQECATLVGFDLSAGHQIGPLAAQ